ARRDRGGQTSLFERPDLRRRRRGEWRLRISQRRRGTRNDFSRTRGRDRPVVPGLAVPPPHRSIRYCRIVRHCRFGDLRSGGGTGATVRLRTPALPVRLYCLGSFLIPGFPLIAALLDLLQHQTVAAVSRFAYGLMILLAVALGLSIVIEVGNVDIARQPPLDLAYPLTLLLRAVASFLAACAFAMWFSTPLR